MDKNIFKILTLVAFVLYGTNASFATTVDEDGFQIQSLSVDNTIEQDNTTSINMSSKKFPKPIKEKGRKRKYIHTNSR